MMDSAEGLCELVSVLCKLSDEMSLPLSAFFFVVFFLPFCLVVSIRPPFRFLFPPIRFLLLPFCLFLRSRFLPFCLTPSTAWRSLAIRPKRTLILDDKRPKSFSCMPLPGRPGVEETT